MVSPDRLVAPDRVQSYDKMPAPVRPQHTLTNWTSVRLGNDPNTQKGKDKETGEQLQILANSNTIDVTSEDSESTDDDDLEY